MRLIGEASPNDDHYGSKISYSSLNPRSPGDKELDYDIEREMNRPYEPDPDADFKPSKSWFRVPGSKPAKYITSNTSVKRRHAVLNDIESRPPKPGELAAFLNKRQDENYETLDYVCNDFLLKKGLIQVLDKEKEDDSRKVDLPSGYYEFDVDANNEYLLECQLREDVAIHLGPTQGYLEEDIQRFLDNRALFEELGCQYRRGFLLYGPPGTGKTTLIRTLLRTLMKEPTIVIDTKKIPSEGILTILREDPRRKIFVFEELTEAHKYNPQGLLTFLDGEHSMDNSIIFATTNYAGSLPANLVARPGRFDLVLRVPDPDDYVRTELLRFWLGREPDFESEVCETRDLVTSAIREAALQSRLKGTTIKEEVELYRERVAAAERDFGDTSKEIGF